MRHSSHFAKLGIGIGCLLLGWGWANLIPILGRLWSPFQVLSTALANAMPIWLWSTLLLTIGCSLLYWTIKPFHLDPTSPDPTGPENTLPKTDSLSITTSLPSNTLPSNTLPSNTLPSNTLPSNNVIPATLPLESAPDINSLLHTEGASSNADEGLGLSTINGREKTLAIAKKITHPDISISHENGPKVVAIGGGTGMPQLLRGLREYTNNITAIVTVADDGGSSGRLRFMGMLPPGDFRNNIAALSESEDLITRLFQYRFAQSQLSALGRDETGLAGHNFGNLFIATMTAVTGSFESGLAESSRVLAVRGRVLPSTLEQVTLCAEVRRKVASPHVSPSSADLSKKFPFPNGDSANHQEYEWTLVEGESKIPEAGGTIQRVFLKPQSPRAYPEAIRAILQADLILAGPGSFFTSIIPNLLVPAVRDAIKASGAPSIYLCNVATQPGETDNYTVSTHMHQLRLHAADAFTTVLANNAYDLSTQPSPNSQWVPLPKEERLPGLISDNIDGLKLEYRLFTGDLADEAFPDRHDSRKLAGRVMEVYNTLKEEKATSRTS